MIVININYKIFKKNWNLYLKNGGFGISKKINLVEIF